MGFFRLLGQALDADRRRVRRVRHAGALWFSSYPGHSKGLRPLFANLRPNQLRSHSWRASLGERAGMNKQHIQGCVQRRCHTLQRLHRWIASAALNPRHVGAIKRRPIGQFLLRETRLFPERTYRRADEVRNVHAGTFAGDRLLIHGL